MDNLNAMDDAEATPELVFLLDGGATPTVAQRIWARSYRWRAEDFQHGGQLLKEGVTPRTLEVIATGGHRPWPLLSALRSGQVTPQSLADTVEQVRALAEANDMHPSSLAPYADNGATPAEALALAQARHQAGWGDQLADDDAALLAAGVSAGLLTALVDADLDTSDFASHVPGRLLAADLQQMVDDDVSMSMAAYALSRDLDVDTIFDIHAASRGTDAAHSMTVLAANGFPVADVAWLLDHHVPLGHLASMAGSVREYPLLADQAQRRLQLLLMALDKAYGEPGAAIAALVAEQPWADLFALFVVEGYAIPQAIDSAKAMAREVTPDVPGKEEAEPAPAPNRGTTERPVIVAGDVQARRHGPRRR